MNDKNLVIKNLKVSTDKKVVLDGVDLSVPAGSVHVIMGPNGSGKSSLANAIMGHPKYFIEQGEIFFCGLDINSISVDKRAKLGLFLSMQHPTEIEGVSLANFLRQAYDSLHSKQGKGISIADFNNMLCEAAAILDFDKKMLRRSINLGFSGGEKKRMEILQLLVLKPKLAILDEIDSGLDIDALKVVCNGLTIAKKEDPELSILLITHYNRILEYIKPDVIYVMRDGCIARTGGADIATELEAVGYHG
jgi:Fe-S cluster assembly ATP-binding protein